VSPGFAVGALKHLLVGKPIPSHQAHHERYTRSSGLAILSSDALSSVAYATEEILRTLIVAGTASLWLVTPIGCVIAGLMLVIAFSYRQTIHAYPGGGGAYRVARENIGTTAGLVAAAALLLDYVLTVAVSIAAGVAAITSAFPAWHVNTVELALGFLVFIAIGNLRGIRESARIFSVPTYFFLGSMGVLLVVGVFKVITGQAVPIESAAAAFVPPETGPLTLFLVLRAFANGCTALTGIEAISDGVPAFKPPEAKNAAITLLIMAICAVVMFMGVTLLADAYHVVPREETVISQLNRAILGGRGPLYYMVQFATTMILVLAANTAFSDFPRLASIIARDKFLPRQLANQGDRLAFSNGIVILSCLAGVLLILFGGQTHALIPLYMLGVFVSFTLSQAGMVIKWRRERKPGWRVGAFVSGLGAVLTLVVLFVVAITKFKEGAWIIRPHPDPRRPLPRDQQALSQGRVPAFAQGRRRARAAAQHRDRSDRRRPPRRRPGARVRAHALRRRARDLRRRRSARHPGDSRGVAAVGQGDPSRDPCVPVPLGDGAAARIHRADQRRASRRLRHGPPPRVRPRPLVAPPVAQPARAPDQGRAPLPPPHRRDERSVSPPRLGNGDTPLFSKRGHRPHVLSEF
jgi:amino acid transporter